jgi:hypothetical protein
MKTKSAKFTLMALVLALPLAATADPKPGTETREWLDLQKSGKSASKVERPVTGEIAEKTYDRYLKSFDQPIPEKFDRESFSKNGGGGSGGGGQ